MLCNHADKEGEITDKNRIHAVMAKNGVKHEFTDLFGVEGTNFLKAIELPESQRIALDVLLGS